MPQFLIDRVPLLTEPRAVDVEPAGSQELKLPGGQRVFIDETLGVVVEAVFGQGGLTPAALKQLEQLRGTQGTHLITFDNLTCNELIDLFVYMPRIPRTYQGGGVKNPALYAETTIRFSQLNPAFSLLLLEWWFYETAGYSIGDNKWVLEMPAAGRFLINGLGGYCPKLSSFGAPGDLITIQLRNSTQGFDYLSTKGNFKFNSGTGKLEDQVFGTNRTFMKGDLVHLDIDAVTSVPPSAGSTVAIIQALVEIYGP